MEPSDNARLPESPHRIPTTLRNTVYVFGVITLVTVAMVIFTNRRASLEDGIGVVGGECMDLAEEGRHVPDPNFRNSLTDDDLVNMFVCLEPFEAIVIVEGIPGVSGTIQSNGLHINVHGDSTAARAVSVFSAFAEEVGQCNVAGGGSPFHTKFTATVIADESVAPVFGDGDRVLTIDAGVSGGGDPFMAVVVDVLEGPETGAAETTHNYVPSLPDANATINVEFVAAPPGPRVNQAAGIARLSSTFHNDRDFFPFTEIFWAGDPIYDGTITIICGG